MELLRPPSLMYIEPKDKQVIEPLPETVEMHTGQRDIKRRQRLSTEQLTQLEAEYLRDPTWSTEQTKQIAQRLQLNRIKVYKWGWDRKRQDTPVMLQESSNKTNDQLEKA